MKDTVIERVLSARTPDHCHLSVIQMSDLRSKRSCQRDILPGIVQHIQIRENRAHLRGIEVPCIGAGPVWNPMLGECPGKWERPSFGGSQKDRDIPVFHRPVFFRLFIIDLCPADHLEDLLRNSLRFRIHPAVRIRNIVILDQQKFREQLRCVLREGESLCQFLPLIIGNSAHFPAHDLPEDQVHCIDHTFAASEVGVKIDPPVRRGCILRPGLCLLCKDLRICHAEPVDALLDIPDHEAVLPVGRLSRYAPQKQFLDRIRILIFIDIDLFKMRRIFVCLRSGNVLSLFILYRHAVFIRPDQDPQRIVGNVRKVGDVPLFLHLPEGIFKQIREPHQDVHKAGSAVPQCIRFFLGHAEQRADLFFYIILDIFPDCLYILCFGRLHIRSVLLLSSQFCPCHAVQECMEFLRAAAVLQRRQQRAVALQGGRVLVWAAALPAHFQQTRQKFPQLTGCRSDIFQERLHPQCSLSAAAVELGTFPPPDARKCMGLGEHIEPKDQILQFIVHPAGCIQVGKVRKILHKGCIFRSVCMFDRLGHGIRPKQFHLAVIPDPKRRIHTDKGRVVQYHFPAETVYGLYMVVCKQRKLPCGKIKFLLVPLCSCFLLRILQPVPDLLAQLGGRCIGKRDDQHPVDFDRTDRVQDLVQDSLHQHSRLAGAGGRTDQQRLISGIDHASLFGCPFHIVSHSRYLRSPLYLCLKDGSPA